MARQAQRLLLLLALVASPILAQEVNPYTYYGGEVDAGKKNTAVEACEYRVLVEEQRCNDSLNKSECIKEAHAECLREFGPDQTDEDSEAER